MGLLKTVVKKIRPILIFPILVLLLLVLFVYPGVRAQETASQGVTSWKLVRQKNFPNYKVEIMQRWTTGKWPRVDAMKARIIPTGGGDVTEFTGTWLTPDPRDYIVDWKGGVLDMTGDGLEDLVMRNSTGGAHCCNQYVIFSLGNPLKKFDEIDMKDCGEKIRLVDINQDGKPEIVSCDAKFTYLGELPYSESPFPPAVYALGPTGYQRADPSFRQVYLEDIQRQKATLAKAYRPAAALQIVTDYFLMGEEAKGWQEFETLYQGKDKEKIKVELLKRLGLEIPEADSPGATPKPGGADDGGSDALEVLQ